MALINCPECSKEFSDRAANCPNCGYVLSLDEKISLHCDVDTKTLLNQGRIHKNQGDYEKAIKYYTLAAEKGDSTAQNNLGVMYDEGTGVVRDRAKALYWYEKAIENCGQDAVVYSNAGSTSNQLGQTAKAIEYYTVAAGLGNVDAQFALGKLCFKNGDYRKAVDWMDKVMKAGHPQWNEAQNIRSEAVRKMWKAPASQTPARIPITQSARENNKGANIGPTIGLIVCICIVIVGFVVLSTSTFLGGLLIVAFGGAMGIFALSSFGNAGAAKRQESVTSFVSEKSGTAFNASCAEVLPDVGDFAVDTVRGKWTYGNSGKVYPISLITNISIEYETKRKDNMTKRVVAGTVLGGGAGAIIGAATSSAHDEKTGDCKLTFETTEPGFGKLRFFTVSNSVGEAIINAVQQAKAR